LQLIEHTCLHIGKWYPLDLVRKVAKNSDKCFWHHHVLSEEPSDTGACRFPVVKMRVLVTVGTTKFPELVASAVDPEIASLLVSMGYNHMEIQAGPSQVEIPSSFPLTTNTWSYKPSLAEDMESADLVISHAGAGTCLEVLRLGKPLIVIVNRSLLGNHQMELAGKLAEDGHLICGENLIEALLEFKTRGSNLTPFQPGDPKLFSNFLDNLMGVNCLPS